MELLMNKMSVIVHVYCCLIRDILDTFIWLFSGWLYRPTHHGLSYRTRWVAAPVPSSIQRRCTDGHMSRVSSNDRYLGQARPARRQMLSMQWSYGNYNLLFIYISCIIEYTNMYTPPLLHTHTPQQIQTFIEIIKIITK